jgi:NADH dehydrogenase
VQGSRLVSSHSDVDPGPPEQAELDVVTGAFGYTGRYIAAVLAAEGRSVRTLTAHLSDPSASAGTVDVAPFAWDDEAALIETLRDATTLYNTYWIRFPRGAATYERAVANTLTLIRAARAAAIRRFVHVSIANASPESDLPYFRAKGLVERELRHSGLSHAIVRPTVLFGGGDVLINNIAWFLRRFPLFAVPGSGEYRLQPVFVEDVARTSVEAGRSADDMTIDAAGPEIFSFDELVALIATAVGRPCRLVHVSPLAVRLLVRAVGASVRDIVLTRDELTGLMRGLLVSGAPPTGTTSLRSWLDGHADELGVRYASELARHYW